MSPRRKRDVLHARTVVVVEVFLNLRLAPAGGRLVDRELDAAGAVLHHLRHQRRILGRDLLVVEVHQLREPHRLGEELHPAVHLAQLDVADDVIDGGETDRRRWVESAGRGSNPGANAPP